jgi:hypothetical protein
MVPIGQLVDPTDEQESTPFAKDSSGADNLYQDLTFKGTHVSLLFFVQSILVCIYMADLNDGDLKKAAKTPHSYHTLEWFTGVCITFLAVDETSLGGTFNPDYWFKVVDYGRIPRDVLKRFKCCRKKTFDGTTNKVHESELSAPLNRGAGGADEAEESEESATTKLEIELKAVRLIGKQDRLEGFGLATFNELWFFRSLMDFAINGIARTIIMYTFPLLLCTEGSMDFIKDCTAVLFISKLDDLEGDSFKPFKEIAAKLKFKLYHRLREDDNGKEVKKHLEEWNKKENPSPGNPQGGWRALERDGHTDKLPYSQRREHFIKQIGCEEGDKHVDKALAICLTEEEVSFANDEDEEERFQRLATFGKQTWDKVKATRWHKGHDT